MSFILIQPASSIQYDFVSEDNNTETFYHYLYFYDIFLDFCSVFKNKGSLLFV